MYRIQFLFSLFLCSLFLGCQLNSRDSISFDNSIHTPELANHRAERPKLDFIAYLDIPQSLELSFSEFLKQDSEPEETPTVEMQNQNLKSWLVHFKNKGATIIGVEAFNRDGEMYFPSKVLNKSGFQQKQEYGDVLEVLLSLCQQLDLKLSISIEDIAHIVYQSKPYSSLIRTETLTPDLVESLIDEFGDYQKTYGVSILINEEVYELEYIQAIERACKRNEITYTHYFDESHGLGDIYVSEDYAIYPQNVYVNEEDQNYLSYVNQQGTSANTLGVQNAMFAHAETLNKRYGCLSSGGWGLVNGAQQNVCLMRAIQFKPSYFGFITASYEERDEDPLELKWTLNYDYQVLRDLIAQYGRSNDLPKAVANLILVQTQNEEFQDSHDRAVAVASSALLAAGFDLRVTYGKILDSAQLYYVIAPASQDDSVQDLNEHFLTLAKQDKRIVFHPVGFPEGANWQQALSLSGGRFNAPMLADENYNPMPLKVQYDFPAGQQEVFFRGHSIWEQDIDQIGQTNIDEHRLSLIHAQHSILSAAVDTDKDGVMDQNTSLILRNKNVFFINGAYLHQDFSSILTNVLASKAVYNTNSYGYLTTGESRSVFFATADTNLDINLLTGKKIIEFDQNGQQIDTQFKLEKKRLWGQISKWHLLVILSE